MTTAKVVYMHSREVFTDRERTGKYRTHDKPPTETHFLLDRNIYTYVVLE